MPIPVFPSNSTTSPSPQRTGNTKPQRIRYDQLAPAVTVIGAVAAALLAGCGGGEIRRIDALRSKHRTYTHCSSRTAHYIVILITDLTPLPTLPSSQKFDFFLQYHEPLPLALPMRPTITNIELAREE